VSARVFVGTAMAMLLGVAAAAQIGGRPISGGNPTPGTPQPDPPDVANRITVTGCVELAKNAPRNEIDGNTVIDSRYVLTSVELPSKLQYKLAGIESQLSPFTGAKVEVSGEPKAGTDVLQVEFIQRLAARCR
jgi:hypothetical protein